MNPEDAVSNQSEWETCVVCGENVEPGRGAMRINHRGSTVNLCGPQCLRTFAKEPDPYLARLAKTMRERALREEKVFA
jgi:ribosomal protein L24E